MTPEFKSNYLSKFNGATIAPKLVNVSFKSNYLSKFNRPPQKVDIQKTNLNPTTCQSSTNFGTSERIHTKI